MMGEGLHVPHRGDAVDTWLQTRRERIRDNRERADTLTELLDDYHRHADTLVPIDQEVTS